MFKQRLLCSSIATVTALGGLQAAQAQDAELMEEIVITGVRASVNKAIDIKQQEKQIVDSIVAEDVGKLPDNSVAEALQRVTGVQIARQNGEASTVLVRGLPDVVTTVNGRNIFTTTGRGIALADIPADLLQRVDVKKSASAADIEGGIAGVVDVHLRRPFDFDDGFTIAGGLRNVYSEQAESNDPVGSVTMNNNWSSGNSNFGAMFSVSYQDRGYMDQVNFVTAPFATEITHPDSVEPPIAGEPTLIPNVIGSYFRYGDRNRTSYNGAFQWSPNEDAEYYAEFFHVGYEQDSQLNFWVPIPSWGGQLGYVTEYKPGTNVAKEYVRDDAPGTITSNQAFFNSSDTTQIAFGGEWSFDNLTVSSDLAYTTSEADNESFILDLAFFAPRITYDFSKNGSGASDVTIENADGTPYDLSDPSQYVLNQFFDQRSRQEGDEISWKTDFNYAFDQGAITSLDFGLRLSQRNAFNQSADTGGRPNISGSTVFLSDFPGLEDMTPSGFLSDVVSLNTSQWLTPNREYLLANRTEIREALGYEPLPGGPEYIPELFFDNDENNYAAYVSANYDVSLGGMILDGQVGARLVRLESTLRGTSAIQEDGAVVLQSVDSDTSTTKLLPNASARLAIRDDLYLRGAISQTITRPGFADLNPSTAYFQPTPTQPDFGTGNGGNPELDSVESGNLDVSLEWYFADSSSLTAGLFYRDIDGYIQFYSSPEMRDGVRYQVTRPQNTGSGSLEGVELAYTQFFDNLPGFWSGFGIQANATFMDGEAESPPDAEGNTEMQNLANVSDESYNLILLYEKNGFSARLAYNWRSDYYSSFDEAGDQPGNSVVVTDTDSLDLALNYDLNDNLTLSAEATNLTDSVYSDYFGGGSSADESLYPRDTFARERTYSLGVRFRY
ncbi:TonB-dependent receptor [Microbulbifer rhizosphaerae]|uniref:TonB-dependent receptor n=1 Tax=Microbulbifer rhizosphaerae TaxID=1562603 RepID=A0A7W4Z8J2_9GAMM|nr:TonB-dependent receptor [Microbulbifer rhizosphaerae]MBB3060868.1 TonB-dependent receptor [Microbulbifer rhizosphaerae]